MYIYIELYEYVSVFIGLKLETLQFLIIKRLQVQALQSVNIS